MRRLIGIFLLAAATSVTAAAQEKSTPFGGFKHDRTEPVEITSDELEVRQAEEIAIFKGNVIAGQGTLRLTAREMIVSFDEDKEGDSDTGAITKVEAKGDVFLSNGSETAQGAFAEYNLETGIVSMTGDVVLTQGGNAGKGKSLTINLNTGVARFAGRPTLVLRPQSAKGDPDPKPAACDDAALAATERELDIAGRYDLICIRKSSTN